MITHCLTLNEDLTWALYVLMSSSALNLPGITITTYHLLQLLDRLHVCCGQPDSHFISMVNSKKRKIMSSDGKVAASIDHYAPVALNGEHYRATIRTGSCELVSISQK